MVKASTLLAAAVLPLLAACTAGGGSGQTRGIGVYPGDPAESFAPELKVDDTFRNIALHRRTAQSSAYDFNLTSQLVTDGIIADRVPPYLTVVTPDGALTAREREWTIDGGPYSFNGLKGDKSWIEYHWNDMEVGVDTMEITGVAYHGPASSGRYAIEVQVPGDGGWKTSGRTAGSGWVKRSAHIRKEIEPNKQ